MARFDFSYVNTKLKSDESINEVYEDREMMESELQKLNKRWKEILQLPTNDFLSEEISKELDYIHRRTTALTKAILRVGLDRES